MKQRIEIFVAGSVKAIKELIAPDHVKKLIIDDLQNGHYESVIENLQKLRNQKQSIIEDLQILHTEIQREMMSK